MCVPYGAICLIALFVALSDQESNQERVASKQLAAPLPYMNLLTDITTNIGASVPQRRLQP
jgi:flagellar basal body-associated protein FliL